MTTIRSTNTLCSIGVYLNNETNNSKAFPYDTQVNNSLISCSVSKQYGNASSNWQFELAPNLNWIDIISIGDWITITMGDKAFKTNVSDIIEIGQVDDVTFNRQVNYDGSIQSSFSISGRGFGKIFEDTKVYIDPVLTQQGYKRDLFNNAFITIKGTPKSFVEGYMDTFLNKTNDRTIIHELKIPSLLSKALGSNDSRYIQILTRNFSDKTIGWANARNVISDDLTSLWDIMKSSSNFPWNELIFDIIGGKPTVILRPMPLFYKHTETKTQKEITDSQLNNRNINYAYNIGNLGAEMEKTAKVIDSTMIISENLGISTEEIFNYIIIMATNFAQMDKTWQKTAADEQPLIDYKSIGKYGLRKLELSTDFTMTPPSDSKKEKAATNLNILSDLIKLIGPYCLVKHRFYKGTITINGYDAIENKAFPVMGDYVRLLSKATGPNDTKRERLFKVEGIQYHYQALQPLQISLALTHGIGKGTMKENGNKTSYYYLDTEARKSIESNASFMVRK